MKKNEYKWANVAKSQRKKEIEENERNSEKENGPVMQVHPMAFSFSRHFL